MSQDPWKIAAIGMAVVMVTALATGIVVGSRSTTERVSIQEAPVAQQVRETARPAPAPSSGTPAVAKAPARRVADQGTIKACNDQAAAATGSRDKTVEIVKDAAVGAVLGAAVGAAGGAIADGGKGAGKGAAIGGVVGAGAGTLYGINDNRKHDAAYKEAYAHCMRSRGYPG